MTPAARERRRVLVPILVITAAAWFVLVAQSRGTSAAPSCCPVVQPGQSLAAGAISATAAGQSLASLASGWLLMLAAMMAPLLAAPVRHILDRSLARHRAQRVALFVAGYVAIWMCAGVVMLPAAIAGRLLIPNSVLVLAVAAALAWQWSPLKQFCLNRGHAHTELAAFGWSADAGALRFGASHGVWCVGSCWALMLLPEVTTAGHLPLMGAVTVWLIAEKLNSPESPAWRMRGAGKAARIVAARARDVLARVMQPLKSYRSSSVPL